MTPQIQMQVFYEIAMEIGAEADLQKTAKKGLSAYLHKLGCLAGMVLRADPSDKTGRLLPIAAIPRNLTDSKLYIEERFKIRDRIAAHGLQSFLDSLPVTGISGANNYYLMELKGFGVLLLVKSGELFDQAILHGISRLNLKLAQACLAGLYTDRLEVSVQERTKALQETNNMLKETLANVKTLSGLLPICAGCKKIRDDKGYWNQIESYVRQHSNAEFTHGLCPACTKRLYPEYTGNDENPKKKEKK